MNERLQDLALDQLFRAARTYNGYLEKRVPEELIRDIWDLLKFGPTSANCLPARFFWCVSPKSKQRLAEFALPANAEKILAAPVTAIIASDQHFYNHLPELFPHADAKAWFANDSEVAKTTAFRNSSMQGAYFILAARALGLDTGPMSGFNNDAIDAAFFSEHPSVKSNFIATLGYGDTTTIFDRSPRPSFERFNWII